jgi:hypothetical protein
MPGRNFFDNIKFDIFIFLVALYHIYVITKIKPSESVITSPSAESVIKIKEKDRSISDYLYAKLNNSVIHIYDNRDYRKATNEQLIDIYNKTGNKLQMNNNVNSITQQEAQIMKNFYKLLLFREGTEPVNIILFFESREERDTWKKVITDSQPPTYGRNTAGTIVLSVQQSEIKKYLEESKQYINIINDPTSKVLSHGTGKNKIMGIEEATAQLMKLRDNLNSRLTELDNEQTQDDILEGNIVSLKTFNTCDCSLGKLRDLTTTLNYFIIIFSVFFLIFKYVFRKITGGQTLFDEAIYTAKLLLYTLFLLLATLYHGYLLTRCRCSIPGNSQRVVSFMFMLLFPILLIIQVFTKSEIYSIV